MQWTDQSGYFRQAIHKPSDCEGSYPPNIYQNQCEEQGSTDKPCQKKPGRLVGNCKWLLTQEITWMALRGHII